MMSTNDARPYDSRHVLRQRGHARRAGCAWLVLIACTLVACSCLALLVLAVAASGTGR